MDLYGYLWKNDSVSFMLIVRNDSNHARGTVMFDYRVLYFSLFTSISLQAMLPLPPHEHDRPIRRPLIEREPENNSPERRVNDANAESLRDGLHYLVLNSAGKEDNEVKKICGKIRYLVTMKNVDIDSLNASHLTPLFYAVMFLKPHPEVVKTLLCLGADPRKILQDERIRQRLALESHKNIAVLLNTQQKAGPERLLQLKDKFIKKIQEKKNQALEHAEQRVKTLIDAIILQHPQLVRHFLTREEPDDLVFSLALREFSKKQTESDLAKSWEILFDMIVRKPSLLVKRRDDGRTALFDVVAMRSRAHVEQLLILLGNQRSDRAVRDFINIRDNKGLNALNYATQFGAQDIVELLRSRGADDSMPVIRPRERSPEIVRIPIYIPPPFVQDPIMPRLLPPPENSKATFFRMLNVFIFWAAVFKLAQILKKDTPDKNVQGGTVSKPELSSEVVEV